MGFVYRESLPVGDYQTLRAAVGWTALVKEQAQQGLVHSAYVVSCYDDGSIVGAARMIWDRGYIAYLSDVMVMPDYQGLGIGSRLVERAIAYIASQLREGWKIKLVLISAKGKEGFYQKFGFAMRPNGDGGAGMDLWLTG